MEVSQFDRCYVYGGVVDLLTITITINLSTFILSSSPSQHLSNSVSLILFAWVPIHP